jgi:hypothetical protein
MRHPPARIELNPNDPRHAKANGQLTDDRVSKVDGEAYSKWLETGEGEDPCRGSSD